jgi:hypothetical protein
MRYVAIWLMAMGWVPLAGQAWDLRVESPFPVGQELAPANLGAMSVLTEDDLERGDGVILSLNHRLVRVNPVLRLDWTIEYSRWKADGEARVGSGTYRTELRQSGLGAGINAQFWIPFTGAAAELGVIQRFHDYEYTLAGVSENSHVSRTWLRAGARWRLALPTMAPYVAISYQWALSPSHPSGSQSYPDVAACLAAQGTGQEFEQMWAIGAGVQF